MPNNAKTKQYGQLIGGGVALLLALVLLAGLIWCLRQCAQQISQWEPVATTGTKKPAPSPTIGSPIRVNPYGPGDFAYDNGYLTCLTGESRLGVDVSEYQGDIRWQQVAQTDVEFAMIRVGFRAWGSLGELHTDAKALQNLSGAGAAGLKMGVYFFSQAISEEEAREEARFVLGLLDGMPLDLPVVFDWENVPAEDARTANMTPALLNACAQAFCQEIAAAGYRPMVYFNLDFAKRMYDLQALQESGLDFWLAMYSSTMNYPYRLNMWQYTSEGTVAGIDGYVDLNLYFEYTD